jgi:hypothetical protein
MRRPGRGSCFGVGVEEADALELEVLAARDALEARLDQRSLVHLRARGLLQTGPPWD